MALSAVPSHRRAMVLRNARRADARAGAGLGGDPRAPAHADCRADRIRQDARGVSHRARRSRSQEGLDGAAARRSPRRLRLAAEGAERRHPQEPRRAAPRHPRASPRSWASSRRASRRRCAPATRPQSERAAMLRTPPHILVTTPESLYLLLTAERSREMLRTRAHRDRRRDPRRDRHAPRRAPGAVARAAAAGRRAAAAAHRPVGDAEADRGGRAVSRRRRRWRRARSSTKAIAARWISALEMPRLAARSGDVARGVGGVLRPAHRR